jgi:hypothetical protein
MRSARTAIVDRSLNMRDCIEFGTSLVQGLAQPHIFIRFRSQSAVDGRQLIAGFIMHRVIAHALIFGLKDQPLFYLEELDLG